MLETMHFAAIYHHCITVEVTFNIRSVMGDCVGHIFKNVITYLSVE